MDFTLWVAADGHGMGMICSDYQQRLLLVHPRSDVLDDLMKVTRLLKRQPCPRLVMTVIDSPTFHQQHEAFRTLREHLERLYRHFHQRRLFKLIVKQMILHVTVTEQTQ